MDTGFVNMKKELTLQENSQMFRTADEFQVDTQDAIELENRFDLKIMSKEDWEKKVTYKFIIDERKKLKQSENEKETEYSQQMDIYNKVIQTTSLKDKNTKKQMEKELSQISGRSLRDRKKEISAMNKSAVNLKNCTEALNAYENEIKRRNELITKVPDINLLSLKIDILLSQLEYQKAFIKAYGHNDDDEKEQLAQAEYESYLKQMELVRGFGQEEGYKELSSKSRRMFTDFYTTIKKSLSASEDKFDQVRAKHKMDYSNVKKKRLEKKRADAQKASDDEFEVLSKEQVIQENDSYLEISKDEFVQIGDEEIKRIKEEEYSEAKEELFNNILVPVTEENLIKTVEGQREDARYRYEIPTADEVTYRMTNANEEIGAQSILIERLLTKKYGQDIVNRKLGFVCQLMEIPHFDLSDTENPKLLDDGKSFEIFKKNLEYAEAFITNDFEKINEFFDECTDFILNFREALKIDKDEYDFTKNQKDFIRMVGLNHHLTTINYEELNEKGKMEEKSYLKQFAQKRGMSKEFKDFVFNKKMQFTFEIYVATVLERAGVHFIEDNVVTTDLKDTELERIANMNEKDVEREANQKKKPLDESEKKRWLKLDGEYKNLMASIGLIHGKKYDSEKYDKADLKLMRQAFYTGSNPVKMKWKKWEDYYLKEKQKQKV